MSRDLLWGQFRARSNGSGSRTNFIIAFSICYAGMMSAGTHRFVFWLCSIARARVGFGGNQIPGEMMPSQSTYNLDETNQIDAHQIDVETLQGNGFVLADQPGSESPRAFDRSPRSLTGDLSSGGTLSPASDAVSSGSGITQLTGDVAAGPGSGSQAATIAAHAVSNPKLAQMAANTLKGNNGSSTANAADLTAAQATAMLNPMVGDRGSGGTKGLVPAPGLGAAAAGEYLKADGTWSVPVGTSSGINLMMLI